MPRRIRDLAVAAAFAFAGCSFLTDFDPEGQPCDDQGGCLQGYQCVQEVCVAGEGSADGGHGGTDAGTVTTYEIVLDGVQLVPPRSVNFQGSGTLTYDSESNVLSWNVTHDVPTTVSAHLHYGHPFEEGPVIYPLPSATSPMQDQLVVDGALEEDLLLSLRRGFVYLDIHDVDPDVRPTLRGHALLSGARLLRADLVDQNTGGPAGAAGFVLDPDGTHLHFGATFQQLGENVNAAHVHAIDDGRVLTTLLVNPATPSVTYGTADIDGAAKNLLQENQTYFNAHTDSNLGGRARGNILLIR